MPTLIPVVSLRDFIIHMDVFSDEYHAYLDKRTGELVTISDEEISIVEEDLNPMEYPEWQQPVIKKAKQVLEEEEYLSLPSKYDIHEYSIMERFCNSIEDGELSEELNYQIRGSGAFRRFKDAIHRNNITDDWYRFRERALEEIAKDWLKANGIDYIRNTEDQSG